MGLWKWTITSIPLFLLLITIVGWNGDVIFLL